MHKRTMWTCEHGNFLGLPCEGNPICVEEERVKRGCTEHAVVDPQDLAALEADARIGRAVEEWVTRINEWLQHAVYGNANPRALMVELQEVIAKAREGGK